MAAPTEVLKRRALDEALDGPVGRSWPASSVGRGRAVRSRDHGTPLAFSPRHHASLKK
jgi:hypothetical protein